MIVEWTGEKRRIPNLGVAVKGMLIDMPGDKANSFIKQGLAIVPKKKRKPQED